MKTLAHLLLASLACIAGLPALAAVTPQTPDVLTGIWWNQNESGWGIHFTQRRDIVFAAWYTYDAVGAPRWLFASDCRMSAPPPCATCISGATCSGTLYQSDGPRFFNQPFDPSAVRVTPVGTLSVAYRDADNATMSYQIGNLQRTLPITRQVFRGGFSPPAINYTDLWWNPAESGWGMTVTQQFDVMFLAWFVYEDTTRPVWYVASSCNVTAGGNGCVGTLYVTEGPPGPPTSSTFDPSQVDLTPIGDVSLTFSDANNGILRYRIEGSSGLVTTSSGEKAITRKLF
jgi:hypothetical protein